jgi:hypothetical protein
MESADSVSPATDQLINLLGEPLRNEVMVRGNIIEEATQALFDSAVQRVAEKRGPKANLTEEVGGWQIETEGLLGKKLIFFLWHDEPYVCAIASMQLRGDGLPLEMVRPHGQQYLSDQLDRILAEIEIEINAFLDCESPVKEEPPLTHEI